MNRQINGFCLFGSTFVTFYNPFVLIYYGFSEFLFKDLLINMDFFSKQLI